MIEFLLGWTASIMSIIGLLLINMKKWQGYIFWLISAPMWITSGMITGSYDVVLTFSVFQIFNIDGLYKWKIRKVKE